MNKILHVGACPASRATSAVGGQTLANSDLFMLGSSTIEGRRGLGGGGNRNYVRGLGVSNS